MIKPDNEITFSAKRTIKPYKDKEENVMCVSKVREAKLNSVDIVGSQLDGNWDHIYNEKYEISITRAKRSIVLRGWWKG